MKIFKRIRQACCHHRFEYGETVFRLDSMEVAGYVYKCRKCGTEFYVPKVKGVTHDSGQ